VRVIILAYDGLEYTLVKKWRLRYIMQIRHGIHRSPISPRYGKPHTPSAWTSFLTGLEPREHGVDDWWSFGRFLDWIRYKPPLVWIKGKRLFLKKLGIEIKPRLVDHSVIRHRTLFDMVKPSTAVYVPAWNEPVEPHHEYAEALSRSVREYISTVWKWHRKRVEDYWKAFKRGDWRLLMAWFDVADIIGHVCITKCPKEFRLAYLALEKLAHDTQKRLPEDTLLLIVSDHGMKAMPDGTGDHTDYGFWSINRDWEWFNPKKITDFFNLILKVVEL